MAQEPEAGCNLQGGLIKDLTGDGEIVARALYSNPITYRPQFGLFLQCNSIPNIKLDGGVERRFVITPFPHQFVPNPTRKTERKGDPFIKEFMVSPDARDAFITILLEMWKKWVDGGRENVLYHGAYVPTNAHIARATSEYIQTNNALDDWLKAKFQITGNTEDIIQARLLFTSYKDDRKEDPTMKDLSEVAFAQLMAYNRIPKENFTNAFKRTSEDGVETSYKAGKYYTGIRRLDTETDIQDEE
jgi:putative DNA primase/helicase